MSKLREFISLYEYLFLISFLIIFITIPIVQSADVKSFCKCVCVNSTIVPLRTDQTCSDCNIAFCIDLMKDGVQEGTPKEGCEVPVCFRKSFFFLNIWFNPLKRFLKILFS